MMVTLNEFNVLADGIRRERESLNAEIARLKASAERAEADLAAAFEFIRWVADQDKGPNAIRVEIVLQARAFLERTALPPPQPEAKR